MNKQLYLEVRRAIHNKDIGFVTTTIDSFPPLEQITDYNKKYYILLIKGELFRSEKNFKKAKSVLGDALSILPNTSLNKIERASIYGRYAFSLYKLNKCGKALPYYEKAKNLTKSDTGRNQYYSLMVLNCLRELKKSDEFVLEVKKVLNTLFTSTVSNLERNIEFIGEITYTIKKGNQLDEIYNFTQNLSKILDSTTNEFLRVYLSTRIAHASDDYVRLVQNKNTCINSLPPEWPIPQKLQILSNLASMFKIPFGDFSTALTLLEDALLLTGKNMPGWRVYILNSLGSTLRFKGNYSRAIEFLKESVKISNRNNNTWALGFAHNTIGMIYTLIGEFKKAETHYKVSLDLNSENKNYLGLGYTFGSMGWLESVQGNFILANELYSRSIDSFKVNSYPPSIILLTKAMILSQLPPDYDYEIQELLTEAKNQIWKKKNQIDKGRYFISLGNINFNRNNLKKSEDDFIKALEFTDTFEVKAQGLLGITKVRTELFIQTDESKYLQVVRERLNELESIIQEEQSILGLEIEFISAILDMYEGDLQRAEKRIKSLLLHTEQNSLKKLNSQIKKQLQTLSIYQRQQKIEKQIKGSSTDVNMRSQSLDDVIKYLKEMTNFFHSYDSKNVFDTDSNKKTED